MFCPYGRGQVLEEGVGEVENVLVRPVVVGQSDDLRAGVEIKKFLEVRAVCSLEAEDCLLLVSHNEEIGVLVEGKSIKERVLESVGVLMFVCKHVLVFLLKI